MPGTTLEFRVTAEASSAMSALDALQAKAVQTAQFLSGSAAHGALNQKSTILTPKAPPPSAREEYVNWWTKTLNTAEKVNGNFLTRWFSKLSGTGSGSAAQLVSVVSNTASSLASGMNPLRIMAQQLPNAIQAFVMFGDDLVALAKRVLLFFLNPITLGVTAALAAIGTAAYKVHHYFTTLNATIENAGNRFGLANRNAADYASALDSAASAARAFHDWQVQLAKSLDTVAEKTQLAIEKLHEQTKAQQELARSRGASPEQLARMETDALKAELQLLRQARAEQETKNKEAVAAAEAIQKKLVSQSQFENAQDAYAANRTKELAKKRLDEAVAAASKATGIDYFALLNQIRTSGADSSATVWQRGGMPGVAGPVDRLVETTAGSLLKSMENQQVEAGGTFTTIASARNALRDATKTEEDLTDSKEKLTKELQAQQQAAESGKSALHTFDQQIARLENQIGVRADYPFATGGNRAAADLTANQRAGAFAFNSGSPALQAAQTTARGVTKMTDQMEQLIRKIEDAMGDY